jgi:uncharacterized membrane protein YqiK
MLQILAAAPRSSGEMPSPLVWTLVVIGAVIVFIFAFLIIFKKLYKKPAANMAFVRTGQGGEKVAIDRGMFVIGLFHKLKPISLETARLVVTRRDKDALITKDRFRVDVTVEFYIKVPAEKDRILDAARSLGDRSLSPEAVKDLVEAKLVGALRSVAATKMLMELHEDRDGFADGVQSNLKSELIQNGLLLEGVSIVLLDQTDKDALDPNNVFDAIGLREITRTTEAARKEKNEIVRVTEVQIKDQDVTAVKEKLTLEKDMEYATADQIREVETFRAKQEAETQQYKFEQEQAVREREILKEQAVREADISREQRVQEADIGRDLRVKEADIQKDKELVVKQQELETTEIAKHLAVEIAERDRQIGVINKEKEKEQQEALRLQTVAEREKEHQNVLIVEKTMEADRQREVAVLHQRAESEQDQVEKQIGADALAYEIKKKAQADFEASEQQAKAIERLATAKLADKTAEADGQLKLISARNEIKRDVLVQDAALAFIHGLPSIINETMKPAEKISDIRVLNVTGGGLGNGGNGDGNFLPSSSIATQIVSALLQTGAALPLFKELLKFANIDAENHSVGEVVHALAEKFPALKSLEKHIPEAIRKRNMADVHSSDRGKSKS